jgi:hypothetical protein
MRICIIVMITLISYKFALVKTSFSIKHLIHQVLGLSTLRWLAHPGASHPLERQSEAALTYIVRWDGTTPIKGLRPLAYQP